MTFSASGAATEPGLSLKGSGDGSPWSLCRRPWSLMYFTANGRALPCCIAPFSQHGYENYTLGDAGQAIAAGDLERARLSASFARRCFRISRRRPAPIAACAGACEERTVTASCLGDHSLSRRGNGDRPGRDRGAGAGRGRGHRGRRRLEGPHRRAGQGRAALA